jgi:hypothetical protein
LAEDFLVETHPYNPDVPEGHTRFTIDLIQNASFVDGSPLTAEDIAASLIYYFETEDSSIIFGLEDMTAAYAPTPYLVVVEFSTESYWHLHHFAYRSIVPRSLLTSIGSGNNTTLDPFPPLLEYGGWMNSGPFMVFATGWFSDLLLVANPDYYYPVSLDDVTCEPQNIESHELEWGVSENRSLPFLLRTDIEFAENQSLMEPIVIQIRDLWIIPENLSSVPACNYLAYWHNNGSPFSLSGFFSYQGLGFILLQPAVPVGDWDALTQLVPPVSCVFPGAVGARTNIIDTDSYWGFHDEFYMRLSGLGVVRVNTESTWLKQDGTLQKVLLQLNTAYGIIEVQITRTDILPSTLLLILAVGGIGAFSLVIVLYRKRIR